jgi:hypothetical protein
LKNFMFLWNTIIEQLRSLDLNSLNGN